MAFLIGSYLIVVFALPVALSAAVSYRSLPAGPRCPHCRDETIRLEHRGLRFASRVRLFTSLQQRWCLGCGWQGMLRVPRQTTEPSRPTPTSARHATHTLDVRSLTVDGRPWRVMLQYWSQTGLFYGRLLFIAPSGRLWLDAKEAFTGESRHEVLGQVLSMPDGLLTNRLRRLVGES